MHRGSAGTSDSVLLWDFWAGLLLPRHILNAKDVPLPGWSLPAKYPGSLLGVVGLNVVSNQTLPETIVLIGALGST